VPKKASKVLSRMADNGFLGGLSTEALNGDGPVDAQCETDDVILVTVTERRTKSDIDLYVKTLTKAIS
jgi:hypothetical protein